MLKPPHSQAQSCAPSALANASATATGSRRKPTCPGYTTSGGVVMTRCQHHWLADAHGTIEPATIHGDIWLDDVADRAWPLGMPIG